MNDQARQPAGSPTGGQFAPTVGAEAAALAEAGATARATRRSIFASRKTPKPDKPTVFDAHVARPGVHVTIFDENTEGLDFDGVDVPYDVHPGTAESLGAIHGTIAYAEPDEWGEPGWSATDGNVTVQVGGADSFSITYLSAPGPTNPHPVTVNFTGVANVRESIRDICDTAGAAAVNAEQAYGSRMWL